MSPVKKVVEADAVRERGRQHRPQGRLHRGHRAGHARNGFPRKLGDLIDADIERYGLARRKRSAAEVDEKSERSVVARNRGNRRRRDPEEQRERPMDGTSRRPTPLDFEPRMRLN